MKEKELEKAFNFLSITGKYRIIGTGALDSVIYKGDFDLQEEINEPTLDGYTDKIYHIFLNKFKEAEKISNFVITDFKCGEVNGEPIRWNRYNIRSGTQQIGNKIITFQECLLMKSVIKLDLVIINGWQMTEVSENYYLKLGKHSNYKKKTKNEILYELKEDILEQKEEENYLKMLKRLRSFLTIKDKNDPLIRKIIDFINTETGLLGKIVGDLKTIILLKEQNFKVIKNEVFYKNQQILKEKIHSLKKIHFSPITLKNIDRILNDKKVSINDLHSLIYYLQSITNRESYIFVELNKKEIYPYIH
jgi:hypothetical protein